jgi:hypothetical protein
MEVLGGRIGSEHSEGAYHSFTFFFKPSVSASQLYRVAVVSIAVRISYRLVEEMAFELSEP